MEPRQSVDQLAIPTTIEEIRGNLAQVLIRVTSVVGMLAAIMGTIDSLQTDTDVIWPIWLYWGSYLIILILNFINALGTEFILYVICPDSEIFITSMISFSSILLIS